MGVNLEHVKTTWGSNDKLDNLKENQPTHSIFIRKVSSCDCCLLIQFKLVYEPFVQRNMHSTVDFCPRPTRNDTNVPLHKLRTYCPNSYHIYTVSQPHIGTTISFGPINGWESSVKLSKKDTAKQNNT